MITAAYLFACQAEQMGELLAVGWTEAVTAIAACVAAVGTVGAVLVALFGQPWLERRQRPKLTLAMGRQTHGYMWIGPGGVTPETVTMKVIAAPGRRTAIDAEVLLSATWTKVETGVGPAPVLDHWPLTWFESSSQTGPVT